MQSPTRMNRARGAQMSKTERDYEIKDDKRKLRVSKTVERARKSPLETVWERLSKSKKAAAGRGIPFLDHYKGNYRSPRDTPETYLNTPGKLKRPVVPNNSSIHRHTEKPIHNMEPRVARSIHRTQPKCEGVVYICQPLNDIIAARSIHESSSDESKNESKRTLKTDNYSLSSEFSSDESSKKGPKRSVKTDNHRIASHELSLKFSEVVIGCDDFNSTPLTSVRTEDSVCINAHISENLRGFLKKNQCSMDPDEISLVKNVLKMDERHRQLRKDDPELFKDIIKTQLNAILKQEKVLQTALKHLEGRVEADAPSPRPDPCGRPQIGTMRGFTMVGHTISTTSCSPNQEVDIIFKNVPTLEKEIFILKALGDKLEATLQQSVPTKRHCPRKAIAAPKLKLQFDVNCAAANERIAGIKVRAKGVKMDIGFVREFIIAQKSLFELQEDANSSFYLPVNNGKSELKRTNFQKLKQNPHVLMSHIKPKNALVPFNLIDQDPVFFNDYVSNHSTSAKRNVFSESSLKGPEVICEGGDSAMDAHLPYAPLKIEEIPDACKTVFKKGTQPVKCADLEIKQSTESKISSDKQSESRFEKLITKSSLDEPDNAIELKEKAKTMPFEAPVRGKNRRKIRRGYTPMPPDRYYDPKCTITRTIAVGSVQVLLFLLLVMAFTYPDLKC